MDCRDAIRMGHRRQHRIADRLMHFPTRALLSRRPGCVGAAGEGGKNKPPGHALAHSPLSTPTPVSLSHYHRIKFHPSSPYCFANPLCSLALLPYSAYVRYCMHLTGFIPAPAFGPAQCSQSAPGCPMPYPCLALRFAIHTQSVLHDYSIDGTASGTTRNFPLWAS